ncbi:hypothetical protein AYO44_17315 [Planctomycetaceae bacterium SCGC AG-212-F19]|nr:hypothetical protein AYO44_17315 [Planctomycetaceae bacterium SCGC AG-212-F19]
MFDISEIFRSVEVVWLIWLLAVVSLALLTRAVLRRLSFRWLRTLARGEDGASYSLAYVLTVPLYLLLVCTVVESTGLLIAKVGTMYAAYAAARSRIVWDPTMPSVAQERMETAGKQGMVPFASSHPLFQFGPAAPGGQDQAYMAAYRQYAAGIAPVAPPDQYWVNRYHYAWAATTVTLVRVTNRQDPGATVAMPMYTVSVAHDAPLISPLVGRILGDRQIGTFWVRRITSELTLPAEAVNRIGDPLADNPPARPLGITYEPDFRN